MSNKLPLTVFLIVMMILLFAGIFLAARGKKPEESSAEDSEVISQTVIIPSSIPEKLSFEVPQGFSETSSDHYDKYYIMDDASIIITGEELVIAGEKLDDYAANMLEQYQNATDSFRLIEDALGEIDGIPCHTIEFTYELIGETETLQLHCVTAVLMKDNAVYIITCKSRADTFAKYRGTFLRMIESVRISADLPADSGEPQPEETTGS